MAQYQTKDGDIVDFIAYQYYGNTDNQIVEKIYEINPRLSNYGPILPEGILISLPEQQSTIVSNRKVKLWD